MVRRALLGAGLLVCVAGAGAQMYKWTDTNGVVSFSDQPPPANARKVERKAFNGGGAGAALPYALAEAAKAHPVVLYTTTPCEACDQGRALLRQRGIPFAEKTVQSIDDQKKLREAGSDGQVPLLQVGSRQRIGFEAGAWHSALTDAAYPLEPQLPANWHNPATAPAAPTPVPMPRPAPRNAVREEAPPVPLPSPTHRPQPPSDAPPGFRF